MDHRRAELQLEFIEKHHDADEIICVKKTGVVVAALYVSYEGKHRIDVKQWARDVQDACTYEYERTGEGSE